MTRIYVSKENFDVTEAMQTKKYNVVEENRERLILEVPEDEAEQVAQRLGGLVQMFD